MTERRDMLELGHAAKSDSLDDTPTPMTFAHPRT